MHDDNDKALVKKDGKPSEQGKAGWALLWLLGIPLPVLLVAYLISRGC
jgi:hypothetical protein